MSELDLRKSKIFLQAKAGSGQAFDELFSQQAVPVRLFVRYRMGRKLRSIMESRDLVQEVYLHAFRSFGAFEGQSSQDLYRWLCGIAGHRMADERRRLGALKRGGDARFEPQPDSTRQSPVEGAGDPKPGPRTVAALQEEGARMEEAFARLPERDQEVIGLRQFEGLSARETAERMGIGENNVNVIYFRALGRWRTLLERMEKKRAGG